MKQKLGAAIVAGFAAALCWTSIPFWGDVAFDFVVCCVAVFVFVEGDPA